MAEEHDKSYRLLFSHPEMVRQLLTRFVGGAWLEWLDFETLEKVSERDISPQLIRREKDLLWRLQYRTEGDDPEEKRWFYVYLHLEFQSEPQHFMALRMMTYKMLVWEDLVRQGALTPSGKLPPVLAVVVYNGKAPWNAARSLEDLIEPLPGDWEPLLSYRLVDEKSFPVAELAATPGPVATLFQLELSQGFDDIRRGAAKLYQELPGPQYQSLREAFAVWIQTVVVPAVAPGSLIPELGKLLETAPMLEQSVLEWRRGWQEEGRVEGRLEGRQEGQATLLAGLLETKFGPLPTAVRARLESADADQLLEWGKRAFSADALAEIFDAES